MPKRFHTKIGPRDLEILTALDRTPLTAAQLCKLSQTFVSPFTNEHNLRRRLRKLAESKLVRSWPYALVTEGRSPHYLRLTRDGYRLLYGIDVALPHRRYFEEISHGHHRHTYALAELIVQLIVNGSQHGITMQYFARENSLKLEVGAFTMYPDCAFQLLSADGQVFNFAIELDNGTERVRTRKDTESIERKLRGYDAHQSQFAANDPQRYQVLFVTIRCELRLQHILTLADEVMRNRERTVFIGYSASTLETTDPFQIPVLSDHRGLKRTLLPTAAIQSKKSDTLNDGCNGFVIICDPAGSPFPVSR